MDLSLIPPSPMKGVVNLVVEIPAGSRNKYEYCSQAGIMALDRILHSSVRYPFDYGFIPNTLADDCLLYTSPSPRDLSTSRMPSSA